MKAKELMIDDLVHLYVNNDGITNEDVKVVTLCEDSITILNKFGIDEEYREDDVIDGVSAITPIPLTEEILKANGFNIRRDAYYLSCGFLGNNWERSGIEIRFYNQVVIGIECNYFQHTNRVHLIADYVHQLQHALRLCGLNELADNFKIKEE